MEDRNSRTEKVKRIKELEPVQVTPTEPLDKKSMEFVAKNFGFMENEIDNRIVTLPMETIGKIAKHGGFATSTIIRNFPMLFETAIPAWSEAETQKDGHKQHTNVKAYHNYVNKFTDGIDEYFIRFTARENKVKPGKTGDSHIHSTFISEVSIYKNGSLSASVRQSPDSWNSPPFLDKKLQEFFDSVNPNVTDMTN